MIKIRPSSKYSLSNLRNVLCVRLDNMGDVLMCTPAMKAIKRTYPDARITLLTSSSGAAIASLIPEVDVIKVLDAPWNKATAPDITADGLRAVIEELKSVKFDAAVIFTTYTQSPYPAACVCYLADIPRRVAYARENPYQLIDFYTPDPDISGDVRHEVERQLDLVGTVGCSTEDQRLSLAVPALADTFAGHLIECLNLEASPWLVVHPGATAPSRRYPVESYAEAVSMLLDKGWNVLLTGTAEESDITEFINRHARYRAHDLCGKLSLTELSALIQRAPVLLSNNTGPVHIAAAVDTPVVDIYALTNSQHAPWLVPHRLLYHDVPCRNCLKSICPEGHHHCLQLVEPRQVVDAVEQLYAATAERPLRPHYAEDV